MDDLIKTIEEDDVISNYSESDESEDEAQPKKRVEKNKENSEFESDFIFAESQKEYMRDVWNDVSKYIKKKVKTTLDDKIDSIRKERRKANKMNIKENEEIQHQINSNGNEDEKMDEDRNNESSDYDTSDISDDELVHDALRVKERDALRKLRKDDNISKTGLEIDKTEFFEEIPEYDPSSSFYSMNLSRPLLKAIENVRFVHPTPIQSATIPVALAGRDICGCAATGTGKTAAYMLPVLERLLYKPKETSVTRVIVLVPTRELGVQVYSVSRQLAEFTNIEIALSVGGLDVKAQELALRKNPDIVIATPGRLIDHSQNTPYFSLENVEILILDEADRMLEDCFLEQLKEVIKSCSPTRQTLLFSATMTEEVTALTSVALKKPVKIFVDSNRVVAWNLRQEFIRIRPSREGDREGILAALLRRSFRDHTIVFIKTKVQCHRLHILLGLLGIRVAELHGNMNQVQRLHSLKRFKEEEIDVLLTTDVAARGLDISGVKTVINYSLPPTIQMYIHRVGRTARCGRGGRSVSIASEDDRKMVREIIKNARNPVKSRVIPTDVIAKYTAKLLALKPDAKRVIEEEKADRELENLENKTKQLENQLKNGEGEDRSWFQTDEERKAEKRKLKNNDKNNLGKLISKAKKKKTSRHENDENDPEEKKMRREADFQSREAKRSRKQKKIRSMIDPVVKETPKKTKRLSLFDKEITATSKNSVKKLRHKATKKLNTESRLKKQKRNKFRR